MLAAKDAEQEKAAQRFRDLLGGPDDGRMTRGRMTLGRPEEMTRGTDDPLLREAGAG